MELATIPGLSGFEIKILIIDSVTFLPVINYDGREVYSGEYQQTPEAALERAKWVLVNRGTQDVRDILDGQGA